MKGGVPPDYGAQPMIRNYAGMLSNDASISRPYAFDLEKSSVYLHFSGMRRMARRLQSLSRKRRGCDAYSD
jgi:hypothetical protein